MGITSSRSINKWWNPHTKKLKYCSSATFDEDNNKLEKGRSPVSELLARKIFPLFQHYN